MPTTDTAFSPDTHRASSRPRRRLLGRIVLAAGLAVVLGIEPITSGAGLGDLARASETTEDRAENIEAALDNLAAEPAASSTSIAGSWPQLAATEPPRAGAELPTPAEATVAVPDASSSAVQLGGMEVDVSGVDDGSSPESVTMRVEDAATTESLGVTGVVLDLTDATDGGTDGDLAVELTVSYANFAGLIGGDWASRLRLIHLPDCATDTPEVEGCQPKPILTVNDPATQTVTGIVPVDTATEPGGDGDGAFASLAMTASTGGSVAISAGVAGSAGDWSQTGLSPSSAWGTSGNTGAFTWSYPLIVPAPSSGPAPELSLSYSSDVSDGRVPSSNNQSGWIGEGFDLTSSYLERHYVPCSTDTGAGANNIGRETGDLCWGAENATLVFNGAASPLVFDADDHLWRSKSDDGTRVERLTGGWHGATSGEYWKVTTTDGTQYFFGRGKETTNGDDLKSAWTVPVYGNHSTEPCYEAQADGGFASSQCTQVWRWNLDHVIDPSGNTMTYSYATETNHYVPDYANNTSWNSVPYVSGGRLANIEYGGRGGESTTAPFRVLFGAEARCVTDRTDGGALCAGGQVESDKSRWLDTPTDLQCTASNDACQNVVPVFFDTTRLAKVTAQAWDGSTYRDNDSWAFKGRYVGEGDAALVQYAQDVVLRLESVTRTGHGATASTSDDITLPAVQFDYMSLENRVDSVTDGESALWRPRVIRVQTDSGGAVNVSYRTECDAANLPGTTDAAQAANTRLCYLVKWQPDGELQPYNHWFHKYVVESTVEDGAPHIAPGGDLITGSASKVTRYEYLGGVEWAKPSGPLVDPDEVTYSEFRGFAQVATTVGEGTESATTERSTYFRGMGSTLTAGPASHIVTVTDRSEFAGQVFASQVLNGTATLSETIRKPANPVTVATGTGGLASTRIPSITTYGFTYGATGGLVHRTSTTTTNDAAGLPVAIDDRGDLTTTADDLCTKTAYRRDAGFLDANKLSYAAQTETFSAACDTTLVSAELITRDTATYDTAGRTIETGSVDPIDPSADIVRSATTYDTRGRVIAMQDAAGNATTMSYTASDSGQLATITTASPDPDGTGPVEPFTSTQALNPLTGRPVSTTDQNGQVTTGTYDALGRLTSIRHPQHANAPHPTIEYSHHVAPNGLNAVVTRTLGADGQRQHASVVLYDGMLRPFQSQVEGANAAAEDRGRMVSHITYDSAGRMTKRTSPWWAQGAPSAEAINPVAEPPAHTTYIYDEAGRVSDEVFWVGTDSNPSYERWRTTTVFDGAVTLIIPPAGGVPTETVTDARGRMVELREYVRDPDAQAGADSPTEVRALVKNTTAYSYDAAGQLVGMTNPAGDQWSYEYDLAGQLVSSTDPDSGTTTTTYDSVGQVTTSTVATGDTLAYTYDPLGRVTSLRDGSPSGTIRASWQYDTGRLPDGSPALGQLGAGIRTVAGQQYSTSYPTYDVAYRPTRVDTTLPTDTALRDLAGKSYSTELAYTADGQVAQVTYPRIDDGSTAVLGKETVTTRFDAASMPSWMGGGFGWGVYVASSQWNSDGTPAVHDLGNTYGAAVTYAWETGTQRLEAIRLDRERVGGTDLAIEYAYDDAGNVTSMTDAPTATPLAGQTDAQCFQYDGLRRLQIAWTSANSDCAAAPTSPSEVGGIAPFWAEYEYDLLGNRTLKTEHTGSAVSAIEYDHGAGTAGPHQVTSMTTTTGAVSVTTGFGWDAAGNQTSRTTGGTPQAQEWDAEGELVSITRDDESHTNVYDAGGSRLVRIDDTAVTVFLPGGQEVRSTGAGVTATRWYTFAGTTVAVRTGVGMAGVSSIVSDANGTPLAHVHNTEWIMPVQRIRTDPFGSARTGHTGTVAGRGFLGAPVDSAGLTMLGARHYDSVTGTFLSPDPLLDPGVPAQFNAYVYSGNNPVTWSDPTGLSWLGDAFKAVSGFVKKHQAEIGGFVAGALVTAGCLAITAGAGSVGCFIAGGAVAGAVTNAWRQSQSGRKFDAGSFVTDTVLGGALGLLGPVAGAAGRFIAPVASRVAGAVTRAVRPAATRVMSTTRPGASTAVNVGSRATHSASNGRQAASCVANSFVPGTLVLLADGTRTAVEDIQVGDLVLAAEPETGDTMAQPVVATITGEGQKNLVAVTVTDGQGAQGEVIATAGHPFWVADAGAWVDAGNLHPGQWLKTSTGTWVQITAIDHDHREQTVHNLTINSAHTYYVYAGTSAVLTHNCNSVPGGISGMDDIAPYAVQAAVTAGKRGAVQAHHLIEQRFKLEMGGNVKDWATVVLDRKDHQLFTNAWRREIGYGPDGTGVAGRGQIEDAARVIYRNYPNVLKELGLQ